MERQAPTPDPVRPRFGLLIRQDGSELVLVFLPTDSPNVFLACRADTEEPVRMDVTDRLTVDAVAGGQSLVFG